MQVSKCNTAQLNCCEWNIKFSHVKSSLIVNVFSPESTVIYYWRAMNPGMNILSLKVMQNVLVLPRKVYQSYLGLSSKGYSAKLMLIRWYIISRVIQLIDPFYDKTKYNKITVNVVLVQLIKIFSTTNVKNYLNNKCTEMTKLASLKRKSKRNFQRIF